ncbi:hypothetical protein LTR27_005639 [Elasticomyces elasticus]|nr:hypothetical protein LTR27_005639 [Elasticomyces elasticus]
MAPQQPTKPTRPTKHSRSARSARDVRGVYAPLLTEDSKPTATSISTLTHTSAIHAATPSTPHDHAGADTDMNTTAAFEAFKTNKKDKRTIRHQSLLSKVRESGVRKKVLKRRRPGKKLGALGGKEGGMGGLGDALPEMEGGSRTGRAMDLGSGLGGDVKAGEEEWDNEVEVEDEAGVSTTVPAGLRKVTSIRKTMGGGPVAGQARIRLSSVKHKPGAARRKAVMEGLERERMGRNLAGMSVSAAKRPRDDGVVGGKGFGLDVGVGEKDRWAALRKFIGGTMEKREVVETQVWG